MGIDSLTPRHFTYKDLIPCCQACAADVAIILVINAVINYLGITMFFILLCTFLGEGWWDA